MQSVTLVVGLSAMCRSHDSLPMYFCLLLTSASYYRINELMPIVICKCCGGTVRIMIMGYDYWGGIV